MRKEEIYKVLSKIWKIYDSSLATKDHVARGEYRNAVSEARKSLENYRKLENEGFYSFGLLKYIRELRKETEKRARRTDIEQIVEDLNFPLIELLRDILTKIEEQR